MAQVKVFVYAHDAANAEADADADTRAHLPKARVECAPLLQPLPHT